MNSWRQQGNLWQLRPNRPQALVEFIGGSYLAATPQLSYRRLLEDLAQLNIAVPAWAYVPGFDHRLWLVRPGANCERLGGVIERSGSLPRRCDWVTASAANSCFWLPTEDEAATALWP